MGFRESLMGGRDSVKFEVPPESESAKAARKTLDELSKGEFPTIPTREIAPLPEMSEERKLARDSATDLMQPTEQPDFMSLPDVQAIIGETVEQGNLLANRLGRGLQKTGGASATTGRDTLGRAVTDVQRSITAQLAPIANAQRDRAFADTQRRQNLIPLLESLGITEEERNRVTDQAGLDALFNQKLAVSGQTQNFLIPLLEFLVTSQPTPVAYMQQGMPGIAEQAGAMAGMASIFSGFGGGSGGNGGGVPTSAFSSSAERNLGSGAF